MRCGRADRGVIFRLIAGGAVCLLLLGTALAQARLRAARVAPQDAVEGTGLMTGRRYAMGTMFDIAVHHADRDAAAAAIARALDEVARLDRVLSHFQEESDLNVLIRTAKGRSVPVDPSLYEILQEAVGISRRSGGRFDVTVGALVAAWKAGALEGRRPAPDEIARARRCVGYERIAFEPPARVQLRGDCTTIDLGGIGKGYAVDRALAMLTAAGIRDALVNAGGSSIGAAGAPPGLEGWPVQLRAAVNGSRTLLLRDGSLSTSRQQMVPLPLDGSTFGEIVDPMSGGPIETGATVSVIAARATLSDALSTTLLVLGEEEGGRLLRTFDGVAAIWMTPAGETTASHGASRLTMAPAR